MGPETCGTLHLAAARWGTARPEAAASAATSTEAAAALRRTFAKRRATTGRTAGTELALVVGCAWRPIAEVAWRPIAGVAWRSITELAWRSSTELAWRPIAEVTWRPIAEIAWRPIAEIAWRPVAEVAARRPIAELARAGCAATRSAGGPPGTAARGGVARVLRALEVPAQGRGNRTGNHAGQRGIVELAVSVTARLSEFGANPAPQLSLDGGRGARRRAVRPRCFGHGRVASGETQMCAAVLQPNQRRWQIGRAHV